MTYAVYTLIGAVIGFILGRLLHIPIDYRGRPLPPPDLPEPRHNARRPLA